MMHRYLLLVALIACGPQGTVAPTVEPPTAEAVSEAAAFAEQAQQSFASRGDRAALIAAVDLWGKALELDPSRAADCVNFGRAIQLLGETHDREAAAGLRIALFDRGTQMTEMCLRASSARFAKLRDSAVVIEKAIEVLDPAAAPLVYWHANNLGSYAKASGRLAGARYKDRIVALMVWVQGHAPRYEYGGPDRFFGAYHAVVPAFLGGDLGKSRKHFEAAIAIAPGYPANHLLLAEYYAVAAGDRATFDRVLAEFSALKPCASGAVGPCQRAEWAPEGVFAIGRARELTAEADSLF